MSPPIVVDANGNELLEFEVTPHADLACLDPRIPLPLSLVVARHNGETLLVLNGWRGEWELPGGMIEADETPEDAAIREFVEETGQDRPAVAFAGVATFRLMPDHRLEYAAVYVTELANRAAFQPTDEVEQIMWWDGSDMPRLSILDAEICQLLQTPQ
jgi:8-oxo-dGTP diphosphatase